MLHFTRTFHPVGQGAFYSEKITKNKHRLFQMVYDCGSSTFRKNKSGIPNKLKERVESDLEDLDIDLLFISHFDSDHINGVRLFNPKVVILPFVSEEQMLLMKICNEISKKNSYDLQLADAPQEVFPEAHIIRVYPEGRENGENYVFDFRDSRPDRYPKSLFSKDRIKIYGEILEYIVYNPNWDKYYTEFRDKLSKANISWDKIKDPGNLQYFKDQFKILKGIYLSLKDRNLHSLVVYSGFIHEDRNKNLILFPSCIIQHHCWYFNKLSAFLYNNSSCIYFGDSKIEVKWRDDLYNFLKKTNRLKRVGFMQVPHHGSKLSHGEMIKDVYIDWPVLFIISVGKNNSYGHPSYFLMESLSEKRGFPVLVTEDADSGRYFIWECEIFFRINQRE